jgi:hypothetical protein
MIILTDLLVKLRTSLHYFESLLREVRRWCRWRNVCRCQCRWREARRSSQLPDTVVHVGDGRHTRRGGGRECVARGGSQRHGRRAARRRAAYRRAACRRAACKERFEEATALDVRAFAPGEREACMIKRSGASQPWDGSSAPPQLSTSLSSRPPYGKGSSLRPKGASSSKVDELWVVARGLLRTGAV